MLPLFAYIVIKASIPNVFSECMFMESFISEYDSTDRGGYLLVTFQTCLGFLSQLEKGQMEQNAKEIMEKVNVKKELERKSSKEGNLLQGPVSLEKLEKMLGILSFHCILFT
jgi:hypothetical protein